MKLWKIWDKFKLAMSLEVVVLYSHTFFYYFPLKSNQCHETCKLAICYTDPSKSSNLTLKRAHGILAMRSWWNTRLCLNSEGRCSNLEDRDMCRNITWIADDKLSPNFQLRWPGKRSVLVTMAPSVG